MACDVANAGSSLGYAHRLKVSIEHFENTDVGTFGGSSSSGIGRMGSKDVMEEAARRRLASFGKPVVLDENITIRSPGWMLDYTSDS